MSSCLKAWEGTNCSCLTRIFPLILLFVVSREREIIDHESSLCLCLEGLVEDCTQVCICLVFSSGLIRYFVVMSPASSPGKPRGALIVIEGADRVGKTTRAASLVNSLMRQGIQVESLKFPDRSTSIGSVIDQYLKGEVVLDDHAIHLLFSTNRWEMFPRMKSLLESGVSLIVDRYAYSGVAYSAAKPGLSLEWCKHSDSGLIAADCVIYMSVSDEVAKTRPGFGQEVYEETDFQAKVKKNYQILKDPSWIVLNGDNSCQHLDDQLLQIAKKTIDNVKDKPLSLLW